MDDEIGSEVAGCVRGDKSERRCSRCARYELFDHGKGLAPGVEVNYRYRCPECGTCSRVTGRSDGPMQGSPISRTRFILGP